MEGRLNVKRLYLSPDRKPKQVKATAKETADFEPFKSIKCRLKAPPPKRQTVAGGWPTYEMLIKLLHYSIRLNNDQGRYLNTYRH